MKNFSTFSLLILALAFGGFLPTVARAQAVAPEQRQFPVGSLEQLDHLPASRFKNDLDQLTPASRTRALQWLRSFQFTEGDFPDLHTDTAGGICYACKFGHDHGGSSTEEIDLPPSDSGTPTTSAITIPVTPFADALKFHSKPGSTRVLYINFIGQTVTGTAWNSSNSVTTYQALPFDTDGAPTTFSDSEQAAIKQVWQRMAEDYAPFDIDVTTEAPATINSSTAIALITRNTDANGINNPSSTAGGVAYVNVFGRSDYISTYSPAWIYTNNLGSSAANIAEAASHEIGHNLGLSHDGTASLTYYGGHFTTNTSTDLISWGPLMGTGYNRNVSQWSKGEYLNANNTQDDLSIIAGKLAYRSDDRGNTAGTATPLVTTSSTIISSTTPENDPTNSTPANKGILERNTDVDVYSFTTGAGTITLNVKPWVQSSSTKGGNLDVLIELYNQAGTLITSNNPATSTLASVSTTVAAGVYYLHVKNSAAGNPLVDPPTGYTAYGSIGQYFISGTVVNPDGVIVAPVAEAQLSNLSQSGQSSHSFTVTYTDNVAISVASLGTGDIRVTGPSGFNQLATFVSVDLATNGTPRIATYAISPSGGGNWTAANNGSYSASIEANQVLDTENAAVPTGTLGSFTIGISSALYTANMSSSPGWTFESPWSYGKPNYTGAIKLSAGYTGNNVIGHSMSDFYQKSLPMSYAQTPIITNASGASSLTLSFRRWLGLKRDDTAILEVSGNGGTTWTTLWLTTNAVADKSWQLVQYPLPPDMIGSSQICFRWGLSSLNSNGNTAIGWHIDDVELLGNGTADVSPPVALLNVSNITEAAVTPHSCTVTYTDASLVLRSSIDLADIEVIGPAGPLTPLTISAVDIDIPTNGSPLGATYSIIAPGGSWGSTDNGTYTITLQDAAVTDVPGNPTAAITLGTFTVNISNLTPGNLVVTPAGNLNSTGTFGGSFTPSQLQYTLTNSGQTALNWSVGKTSTWVNLSATSGSLAGGANTTVTVSLDAGSLNVGNYSDTISFSNLSNNNGNTTRSVALTVNPAPATVTISNLSQTYNGSTKPVTVTTNPASLNHSVTYNGSTTVPINAGTYTVIATVTNPNYTGSDTKSLVIGKGSQTISFSAPPPTTTAQTPFALDATASSGLTVAYQSSNSQVATISGNIVSIVGPGTTTITASQSGNTNYFAATNVTRDLVVTSIVTAEYTTWKSTNDTAGDITADHDNDGVPNGIEYFLGGPNSVTSGYTPLPTAIKEADSFSVTWVKGTGYTGVYGADFVIETSDSLIGAWTTETVGGTVTITDNNVKFLFPTPLSTKKFARLKVKTP